MKNILFILIGLSVFNCFSQKSKIIPLQELKLYQFFGLDNNKYIQIPTFEISEFITCKEYKKYLKAIKKDSSESFYLSQLPDSSFTIDITGNYQYLNSNEYDNFPILGITWEAAMNYCKWKTLKQNRRKIKYIYRLPYSSEWIASLYYFNSNNQYHDMNSKYAEWTIGSYDDTIQAFFDKWDLDTFVYDALFIESSYKKVVMGDSYLVQQKGYLGSIKFKDKNKGFKDISFRVVKERIESPIEIEDILKFWRIYEEED